MPGEEVPKDEQDENKAPNLRLRFLEELYRVARSDFARPGIIAHPGIEVPPAGGGVTAFDLRSLNGWVNTPDVWTCKLADSENDIVKSNVNAVVVAGVRLLSGIESEISNIYANNRAKVREDDPDAVWTPS